MELPTDSDLACFGVAMAEAIEELVNEHEADLDKRAAMVVLGPPTLTQNGSALDFAFSVRAGQSIVASPTLSVMPEISRYPSRHRGAADLSLMAIPHCDCDVFQAHEQCPHSLAASWWLQEQLGRRGGGDLSDFFAELKVDSVEPLGQLYQAIPTTRAVGPRACPSDVTKIGRTRCSRPSKVVSPTRHKDQKPPTLSDTPGMMT